MGRTVKVGAIVADMADDDRQVNGVGSLARVIEGGTRGVIGMVFKKGHGCDGWREGGLRQESKPLLKGG